MFPDAKFIYIYRNPYFVYRSMMKFLTIIGPLYCVQKPTIIKHLERHVLKVYKKMYKKYFLESKLISKDNLIEIKYEDFLDSPFDHLKKIYNHLSLKGFKDSEENYKKYIKS